MALPRIQLKIIDLLKTSGSLTPEEYQEIIDSPDNLSLDALTELLHNTYKVSDFESLVAKSRAFGVNPFTAARFRLNESLFSKVPYELCKQHTLIPVGIHYEFLIVASPAALETSLLDELAKRSGCKVSFLLGKREEIVEILTAATPPDFTVQDTEAVGDVVSAVEEELQSQLADIKSTDVRNEESGPIIDLANKVIEDAHKVGASDIHIEPLEKSYRIRFRVDGVCYEKVNLPKNIGTVLVTRLKVMANMDIAEKRLPQDGRIVFPDFTRKPINIDLRVSTAPLNHGEGSVMRILDKQKSIASLNDLGYEKDNLEIYKKIIRRPYGMILHCGPTGSGKTTSLYAALNYVNSADIVIRTAEDPIEYTLKGLQQLQVNTKIGLTFANTLRAMLRQDPDVILVGEIRDRETAKIAVEAALTGHLLFSTLHTNDAASTVTRLIEMEVEPYLVSGALAAVCAQRLMRRVCRNCRIAYAPEQWEQDLLHKATGESIKTIYKADERGCPTCGKTGYKGRVGVHEIMVNNTEITEIINAEGDTTKIKAAAVAAGMKTLHHDCMVKVASGFTTMQEALATVPLDDDSVVIPAQEDMVVS